MEKLQKAIVIFPGKNRDDNGKSLDLFNYLLNELEAHKLMAHVFEADILPGARQAIISGKRPVGIYAGIAKRAAK